MLHDHSREPKQPAESLANEIKASSERKERSEGASCRLSVRPFCTCAACSARLPHCPPCPVVFPVPVPATEDASGLNVQSHGGAGVPGYPRRLIYAPVFSHLSRLHHASYFCRKCWICTVLWGFLLHRTFADGGTKSRICTVLLGGTFGRPKSTVHALRVLYKMGLGPASAYRREEPSTLFLTRVLAGAAVSAGCWAPVWLLSSGTRACRLPLERLPLLHNVGKEPRSSYPSSGVGRHRCVGKASGRTYTGKKPGQYFEGAPRVLPTRGRESRLKIQTLMFTSPE